MGFERVADGREHPPSAPRRLSEAIGAIYDCAIDPTRWEQTLIEIMRVLDCDKAILSLNNLDKDWALFSKSVGWAPRWLEERGKHIPEIHDKLREWLSRRPDPDMPFVASRELSPRELATSPYAQNCLKPQGIVDIAHFFLVTTPSQFSELVLGRERHHGIITRREIELGSLLLPHLRRAVTINDLMDMKSLECRSLGAALDSFAVGVIIVGSEGRILNANDPARRMLDARSPILSRDGFLSALDIETTEEMLKAIALARSDETAIGAAGIGVPLRRADATAATAHILPLAHGELRTRIAPRAAAAVFVTTANAPMPADLGTVGRVFGLTSAECRQLEQLMAGATLGEAAVALGVSKATVRTHREHIFAKVGVSRRADLVAVVERLVPPIRRPM